MGRDGDEAAGSDVVDDWPAGAEAIRAAFALRKGSERRSHSEVSVVTTIEDDSRLMVTSVANLLSLYASQAKDEGRRQVTAYDSPFVPKFSVHDFLDALVRSFHISSECCGVAFIYIDRFMKVHPKFSITFANVHRILLTSVVVAAKFFEDVRHPNSVFASFFGLTSKQLAGMELHFVRGLNWTLYVSQEECEECQSLMLVWADQRAQPEPEVHARPRKATSRERITRPRRLFRRF